MWECVLGVMVNPGEEHKVESFREEHPEYKEVRLESTHYVGTHIPYLNFVSFSTLQFKVPQFLKKVEQEGHPLFPGSMEIYHFLGERGNTIELVNPLKHHEQFQLFEREHHE